MPTNSVSTDAIDCPYRISLGRRIKEILLERKITPNSFYSKVGMGRGTFYDCLDGKRRIAPSELTIIADKLNLSLARIKQEDTMEAAAELRSLISKRIASKKAIQLGQANLDIALGITEKFDALKDLGGAYFLLHQYDEAFNLWLKAMPYAKEIYERYGDQERLFQITKNLILSLTIRKDFLELQRVLDSLSPSFERSKPEYAGALFYSKGIVAFHIGNLEESRTKMYESLEQYRLTDNTKDIGTSLHNVAYSEYNLGNYLQSKKLFEESLLYLESHPEEKYYSYKDYAKTLIALGLHNEASQIIKQSLDKMIFENFDSPELVAKFLLLLAHSSKDIEPAKSVLTMKQLDRSLVVTACQILMNHYSAESDSAELMKYYKIMGQFTLSSSAYWRGL
ncbi:hypothetical protein CBW65_05705 [Tumebacillus avium]|uniref:HTH cro/C1-type domain-containing protein n=1 Tax=Tumebacillus avium TaxID=1903704 RepID=A0A1Y0IM54_9BACL|nr:helix-turn-helix transcriptional regulator [Tumebacillus avium]ARU60635.1 hypothetical protein CBW65_05705 [Tumebacillus avium]